MVLKKYIKIYIKKSLVKLQLFILKNKLDIYLCNYYLYLKSKKKNKSEN